MKKHKAVSFILTLCMVLTMIPAISFADTTAEAADTKISQAFPDMDRPLGGSSCQQMGGIRYY